jgi:hypothetical protein
MKNVLLLVFFIVVCGYADRPRFDNEEDDKPIFDNGGDNYEDTKTYKEYTEAYKKIFEKTRFGARIGFGFGALGLSNEKGSFLTQFEGGGGAIIPLSNEGPFLFDIELNLAHRDYYSSENVISIPLLFQFVIDNMNSRITSLKNSTIIGVLEAGAVYDLLLETEFANKKALGFALGAGLTIKKIIIIYRAIYYPYYWGFDEFDYSKLVVGNLGVSYLF